MYMYVTKNLLKLGIFFIAFHSILGKATFLSLSTSSLEKAPEWFAAVEVFIVFFSFKSFSHFAFACHPESIFW